MAIQNVSQALDIINKVIEEKSTQIKTPISLHTYNIKPLQGSDERELKKQLTTKKSSNKYFETLVQILYKKISLKDSKIIFEDFLKNESIYDLTSLIHGLNISTYENIKVDITCDHCENEIKIEKQPLKDFENVSKKWDKEKPFNEYTYDIIIKPSDNIEFIFETFLPNIKHEIILSNILPSNETDLFAMPDTELCIKITKSFKIKTYTTNPETNVKEEQIQSFENVHELKTIFEKLPESILKEVINKYNEEFKEYYPIYKSEIKCPHCGENVELYYSPEQFFISNLFELGE